MTRISWEWLAALAGVAFVVLYLAAFALGIEVGASDREILDHYADSGNRAKEELRRERCKRVHADRDARAGSPTSSDC